MLRPEGARWCVGYVCGGPQAVGGPDGEHVADRARGHAGPAGAFRRAGLARCARERTGPGLPRGPG
ncbi:hypothetical protein ACN6LI_003663, partial [Streptomyces violaceoruber]